MYFATSWRWSCRKKTFVTHVDEGFDFLGHWIRRGACTKASGLYVSEQAQREAIKYKVKNLTTRSMTHLKASERCYFAK